MKISEIFFKKHTLKIKNFWKFILCILYVKIKIFIETLNYNHSVYLIYIYTLYYYIQYIHLALFVLDIGLYHLSGIWYEFTSFPFYYFLGSIYIYYSYINHYTILFLFVLIYSVFLIETSFLLTFTF